MVKMLSFYRGRVYHKGAEALLMRKRCYVCKRTIKENEETYLGLPKCKYLELSTLLCKRTHAPCPFIVYLCKKCFRETNGIVSVACLDAEKNPKEPAVKWDYNPFEEQRGEEEEEWWEEEEEDYYEEEYDEDYEEEEW